MRLSELVFGAAVGAGLMVLIDPSSKLRRRLQRNDQRAESSTNPTAQFADTRGNINDLFYDVAAEQRLDGDEVPADDTLRERVRAALERKVTYAHAIDVEVAGGRVTLRGPVMAYDLLPALSAARAVPGISSVDSQLDVHYTPANAPGGKPLEARQPSLL